MTISTDLSVHPIATAPENKWVLVFLPNLRGEKWRPGIYTDKYHGYKGKAWKVRFNEHLVRFIETPPQGWMELDIVSPKTIKHKIIKTKLFKADVPDKEFVPV